MVSPPVQFEARVGRTFRQQFDGLRESAARTLVRGPNCTVWFEEPRYIFGETTASTEAQIASRVAAAAFVLAALVTGIVLSGAAPLPLLSIALAWLVMAMSCRGISRRDRSEGGPFIIDLFERHIDHLAGGAGQALSFSEIDRADITEGLLSVGDMSVRLVAGERRIRIAQGTASELKLLLMLLRMHHVRTADQSLSEDL